MAAEVMYEMKQGEIVKGIANELGLAPAHVAAAVGLMDEDCTIPFIARYRKELTGEMDEQMLRDVQERLGYLRQLAQRKNEVLRLIDEQGKLTEELRVAIVVAMKLQAVEDLYRPYKQKRKTRASIAKEKGLEPLANWIWAQPQVGDVQAEAARYVDAEQGVASVDEALAGALDILAEQVADDANVRTWLRQFTSEQAILAVEAKQPTQESVYEMYYAYNEPVKRMPPHRILAVNRGEREEILKVAVDVDVARVQQQLQRMCLKSTSAVRTVLETMLEDSYKRLLAPSIEREVRNAMTERAEAHAVGIFSANLRSLLLQPPVKGKVVLAVDPAFRTGCKLAVVDDTGKVLAISVIYPTAPHFKTVDAKKQLDQFVTTHGVNLICIGNGTASRETEQFIAEFLQEHHVRNPKQPIQYLIISEAGASVYSASKLAAQEFPELDVAERSAVSIARRLQDPLAELVKIEPKAIGVGQYQHDITPKFLDESLTGVVASAVNHVGVDANTASPSLLAYVSGINATIAKNIVQYREEHGKFTNRSQFKKVPRLGAKAFEQAIGFIRIPGSTEPLDETPIHPETYDSVKQLLKKLGMTTKAIGTSELKAALEQLELPATAGDLQIGLPTLKDIVESLLRPGRDPRDELPGPIFHTDVLKLEDLTTGMSLQGTVRNVIDFGAFVDIGLKNDGLVHISQLSNQFVKHPLDVVAIGDIVTVWVLSVDEKKGRVSLTMRNPQQAN
jgi:uncharacterized protein